MIYGKTRGTVSINAIPDDVFQKIFAINQVCSQIFRREISTKIVGIPMRCNFVPTGVDLPYQMGKTSCDPAEDEESCLRRYLTGFTGLLGLFCLLSFLPPARGAYAPEG